MMKYLLSIFLLTLSIYATETIKIGVLAFKSKADTLKEWKPTADYLNHMEPEYHFIIIPFTYPEMNEAVKNSKIDFVITNSGHYIYLEKFYHISRIATMLRYKNGKWIDRFGGVIFTKANRADIQTLDDLEGKSVAAVDSESLGGYAAQMFELTHHNISTNDLKLNFTGMPHANVVKQVLDGKADVGFVRTDLIEDMVSQKGIDVKAIKILHPQKTAGFPYLHSTTLYPEWPIARMQDTAKDLSNEVVVALLTQITHTTPKEGDIGWTAPMEYRDIHDIFQALRLPPYDQSPPITFGDIYSKYTFFIWVVGMLSVLIVIGMLIEIILRRKLAYESHKNEVFLTLSGDGIHILDEQGNLVQVSNTFCNMLGYSRAEMIGMNVTQWDSQTTIEEFIHGIKNLSEASMTIYSKHKRKDGAIYDVEIVVTLINSKHKRWVYCSARNVTEKLIKQAKDQLATLVYEYSTDAIVITDKDSNIITINPAFSEMSGYTIEEIQGKSTHLLNSGRQSEEFFRQLWEALLTQGEWSGEIIDRDKEGAIFSKYLSIRTVYDLHHNPYRRIAIFSDITDAKEAKQQIWYQANFDALTGLSNRNMFMYRLEKELQAIDRNQSLLVLMYLDLDHFKEINDTLGHDKGDNLLQEAAKRLLSCVRKNDVVSRLGGDEFTIILNDIDSLDSVNEIASKIIAEISSPFKMTHEALFISVSIGITVAPSDGNTPEILLKNADQAMYSAKNKGRNQYQYFTLSMQETLNKRTLIIHEMREAITKDQFVAFYQPIMELSTGLIYKAEALVRWQKEDGSLMNPFDFIGLAEETGLINNIGRSVYEQAVQQVKKWRKTLHPEFQVSVNKSPVQFRCETNECSTLSEIMNHSNLPSSAIIVEITEGILMENTSVVQHKLLELERQGIAVALDDFGTGYSSLSYLKKFDIDYLKIDRAFVQHLETDENDKILCEAIVAMAHKLRIKVIAEGVETIGQKDYLSSIDCDYIQGYLISRPIPADEFEIFYTTNQTKEH
jgi:diguanylate cyclase (GGDEF)-like protein/PAS domain S-box-containing protein